MPVGRLRNGPALMAAGLALNGAATYVFLTATARATGPDSFALVSVLWSACYLLGLSGFVPIEQEVTRVVAERRTRNEGFGLAVRRLAQVGGVVVLALTAGVLAAGRWVSAELFRDRPAFVALLLFGVAGLLPLYLARGLLAGTGRYARYGLLFTVEAAARALPAVALAAAGVASPVPYGLLIGVGAVVAAAVPLLGRRNRSEPGDSPSAAAMGAPVAFLMLTTTLVAVMANAGTIAVEVLATPAQSVEAGVFLSGLVIARIPLFFFQAVGALVLPRLTALATLGELDRFRRTTIRMLTGLGLFSVLSAVGSALVGPAVLEALFGPEYAALGPTDMALLAASSTLLMLVFTVNQAQIALQVQRWTWLPWAAGVAGFVAVTASSASAGLFRRVELGLGVGSGVALVVALLLFASTQTAAQRRRHAGRGEATG